MKRRWIIIVFVIAVAGVATWMLRTSVADRIVIAALQQYQIPVQSLRVDLLTKNHIILRDVGLGDNNEIKADHADIILNWQGTNFVGMTMNIKQLDVRAIVGENGMTLGGVERAWTHKNAATDAAAKNASTTAIQFTGDLKIHYAMSGTIAASSPRVIPAQAGIHPAESSAKELLPMDPGLRRDDGTIRIELLNDLVQIRQNERAILLPLHVSGIIEGDMSKNIDIKTIFASTKNELRGELNGSYAPAEKSGKFTWKTQAINMAADGITFAHLAPIAAAEIKTFPMQIASSGTIILSKEYWAATPTITLLKMPLAAVLASALGEGALVEGMIGGELPLTITADGWRIQPAKMNNIGGLHIAIQPGSPSYQALSAHPQASIVQAALANFQVEKMVLDLSSSDDHGGIAMRWHFLGANPDLLGGKKVDFTLAVNANLEDILRATASADSMMQQAKKSTPRTPEAK